ncbi:hypothetical protein AVEN_196490-1, partial [Araneus ventricosus]
MDERTSDFYLTLPSNANMDYFPKNTQSFYRTKLSHPLILFGEWEVALSEICIPRNWFNIGDHNNSYSILLNEERRISKEDQHLEIKFRYETNEDPESFFRTLNNQIATYVGDCVKFSFKANSDEVELSMEDYFEIHLEQSKASKFLYILNLADVDTVINTSKIFKFRPSLQFPVDLSFTIFNKNPSSVLEHSISVVSHLNDSAIPKTPRELFEAFKENIELLSLGHLIQFIYNDITSEVDIHLAKNIEIHFMRTLGESLLEKLNLVNDTIVKGISRFQVNRAHPINKDDHFKIIVKEYFKRVEVFKQTHDLFLNVGMYKTEEELFKAFQFITLKQLPNSHIAIEVPHHVE